MSTGVSAGALGFYLWWAVFLPRLLWFTVYLSVQNCFAESSGFASDVVPLPPLPSLGPQGFPCAVRLLPALLCSHREQKHLENRHQHCQTFSIVCISRNDNFGETKTDFQTAVQKMISQNGQRKSILKPVQERDC